MNKTVAGASAVIGFFGFLLLIFFLALFDVGLKKVIWPLEEEARREKYEESRTHVEGTIDDLYRLRTKWSKAEGGHKEMLEGRILRRARDVDPSELPPEIDSFVDSLRKESMNK